MKQSLLTILSIFIGSLSYAQGAFISEIHYDDLYSSPQDSFEFVEVYLPDPQPANLNEYKLTLYQGSDGSVHRFKSLAENCMFGDTPNGGYYVVEFPDTMYLGFVFGGIENGPDGIAFSGPGGVVYDFISYEGSFTATAGPANGMTSMLMTSGNGSSGSPVQENNSTSTTRSLQQNGFDAWTYNVPFTLAFENISNSETGFPGNVPVDLTYWYARNQNNNIELLWETAQEVNNDRFEIWHSKDARSFKKISEIEGQGNTAESTRYIEQINNLTGGDHYFQLKQFDYDGSYTTYDIRHVELSGAETYDVFPTLVDNRLWIRNLADGKDYRIYTIDGRFVQQGIYHQGGCELGDLPKGQYIIQLGEENLTFYKL